MVTLYTNANAARKYGAVDVNVQHVHFDGVQRTKCDALVKECRQLFHAKTLSELVLKAFDVKLHLQHVGLFESVNVLIDISEEPSASTTNHDLDVIFQVKEVASVKGSVSLGVNNRGEGSTVGELAVQNAFGRGEVANAQIQVGLEKTSSAFLKLKKPFLGCFDTFADIQLFRQYSEFPWSCYNLQEHGLAFGISHARPNNFTHNVRWETSWRQLGCLKQRTPIEIRRFAGHSLKSSLVHSHAYSTLDNLLLPKRGILLRLSQEVAGLGGNVNFLKHTLDFKGSASFLLGSILHLGVNATQVAPLGKRSLSIIDRAFLGGPTNLRGFALNSVGPTTDDRTALGGALSWCAAAHLYRPLYPKQIVFGHLFAVAGNVLSVPSDPFWDWRRTYGELISRPRFTVGIGAVVKIGNIARLEFNYCWPYSNYPNDVMIPGYQFGIGIAFM